MRILHVYSGNLFGGIEAILIAIARQSSNPASPARKAERDNGSEVEHDFALCFDGRLAEELRTVRARVHRLEPVRISRPHTARVARQALSRVLKTSSFDRVICHAPWAEAIFGGVVRRTGVPLVFWAHDVMTGRHWTERLARRTPPDLVVCNSEYTAGTLPRLYPGIPAAVVYAPVEITRTTLPSEERRRLRDLLNTPETATVIVQASRSEAWKGHALLLEGLSRLRHIPNWVWWQVGGAQRPAEAAFLASLREAARRCDLEGRIRWVGERTDVPRLLQAADVYCQANLNPEPFGVVFVEALASGLPVVTTDLGGAREIVDSTCGVLVKPGDPSALAGVLHELIQDASYRERLASRAPDRARRLCDPAMQLRRLASVLGDMTAVGAGV